MERDVPMEHDTANQLIDEILTRIDEKRGEMSRVEFTRLLVNSRLEKYCRFHNFDNEREIYCFVKEVIEMLSIYLEMICKSKASVYEIEHCSNEKHEIE